MPNYGNLDNTFNKSTLLIKNLNGWISPITIELGNTKENGKIYTWWKIKGTAHIFTIQTSLLNQFKSHEDHFKIALTTFRDDFIEWYNSGFSEKWMREYNFMFRKFIII